MSQTRSGLPPHVVNFAAAVPQSPLKDRFWEGQNDAREQPVHDDEFCWFGPA
jgi:hypothetical protein